MTADLVAYIAPPADDPRMLKHQAEVERDYARLIPFFAQFIHEGDTVVDAGSFVGAYSHVFLECGASRVIAVEPLAAVMPEAVAPLLWRASIDPRITVVPAALSDRAGHTLIRIARNVNRRYPSISKDWMTNSLHAPYYAGDYDDFPVRTLTLENLIGEYAAGLTPDFIKIDCEGSSGDVVAGLARPVKALNFEVHRDYIRDAARAIAHLDTLSKFSYNFALGTGTDFMFSEWLTGSDILARLTDQLEMEGGRAWGDCWCRTGEAVSDD